MTTAPRTSNPGHRSGGIGPVVRPALLVTLGIGAAAATLAAVVAGSAGLTGALIGTAMVAVFFGFGAVVLDVVARLAPAASLLIALLTYTLKVVLVGLVFVGLHRSGAMESAVDARWLGGTVIAATFGWLAAQVVASMRARVPLYDLPADSDATPSGGTGDAASGAVSKAKKAGAR